MSEDGETRQEVHPGGGEEGPVVTVEETRPQDGLEAPEGGPRNYYYIQIDTKGALKGLVTLLKLIKKLWG